MSFFSLGNERETTRYYRISLHTRPLATVLQLEMAFIPLHHKPCQEVLESAFT